MYNSFKKYPYATPLFLFFYSHFADSLPDGNGLCIFWAYFMPHEVKIGFVDIDG